MWAYSLLWIGIVGLVTSVAGIGFIFLNLRSLNEQNRIAQMTGEAQTRPYLSVSPTAVLTENQSDSLGRNFKLSFAIQNSGTTPAVDPRISVVLYLDSEFTNPPDRESPIFVSVLDKRPTISSGQEQALNIIIRNQGIPPASHASPLVSFTEEGMVVTDEVANRISDDGNMWMCLQINVEYTDIASSKIYSVAVEFETIEKFSFRRSLSTVTFNAERSLSALSIPNYKLFLLRNNCPPTPVFGLGKRSA